MRYLAVIPARGGSKGIPKKNITPLCGKPLLAYTLEVLLEAEREDVDIAVSTDSEEIAAVAERYADKGVCVVKRPVEISGDTASTEVALLHAIDVMEEKNGISYDVVLTMQPTSPFRKAETFRAFLENYEANAGQYDALLSLHETRTDYWIKKEEGAYGRLYPNAPRRRQDREPMYVENSAYYATSVKALRETNSVLGNHVNGFLISEREGLDINEPIDLLIAEKRMEDEG